VDSTEREEERLIRIPAAAVSTTPAVATAVTAVKAPKTAAAPKTAVLDAPPAPSAATAEKVATAVMAEQAVTEEKAAAEAAEHAVITLPLFYDAVSAGLGADLSDGGHDTIDVRAGYGTDRPDFALRVSGDSMEPRFKSGDVLLIHQQDAVSFGEFGIFIADGAGYFKRFMGDRLHSLNPNYPDIPLRHFDDYFCCGKVVGHMKKKS
jgi:phage repressor protein C with HTH and peptisase S24 domain